MKFELNSAKVSRHLKTPVEMMQYINIRDYNRVTKQSPDTIITGSQMIHYLVKGLVMCLCTIGCTYQIVTIVTLFFDYPTIVFVNVRTMDKLYLPGITLCNSNRLMLSKLKDFDPDFEPQWTILANVSETDENIDEIKLKQQHLIDEYMRKMMDKLPVSQFMSYGHTADDFLVPTFFRCASDKYHPDETCIKFANVITTAQDLGNCFTLFHRSRSEVLSDIAIDSGLSQSPVRRGTGDEAVNIELSEEPFHPNEILRLKLDFHSSDYTTLNEPVNGRIIIHDDNEAPTIREKSFTLTPGNYYEFYISSKENCIIGCMAQNTMDKCQCWPPELPFMRGTVADSQENSMNWCDWETDFPDLSKPADITWFQYCFTVHEQQCKSKCNSDCSIDRYRIIKEVRQWPATERIEHSIKGDYLYEMRQCCAIVSIRYWSAEETINKYQPKFEIAEFTSNIGGLLSMWVGFSLLGFYDVLEAVTVYLYKRLNDENDKKDENHLTTNVTKSFVKPMTIYNTTANYDEEERKQWRRKTWQRKFKFQ
ncbi:uncharacterized protein LOC128951269 [Oppia nitens]|uniref:uncharacterized protein LOC128951269 n=1 Tax=Oppia nitens TaxID=1686743 RepID=UPI0023DB620B|nr:uncharacterized protein LOC128951269 [Oppia nitens]